MNFSLFKLKSVPVLALLFLFGGCFSTVEAKSGDIDFTFGNNGFSTFSYSDYFSPTCMKVQEDGKIVVGGYITNPDGYTSLALARFTPNGNFDHTFGVNGLVVTNTTSYTEVISKIEIQPDGKIVAVGYGSFGDEINGFGDDVIVARYNNNGSLDESFGTGGIVSTAVGVDQDNATSVIVLPNGKILVTGYAGDSVSYDMFVLRYKANGTLDNTFNSTGKVIISTPVFDVSYVARLQVDGKIVIGGTVRNDINSYDTDFLVARLNANGTLDNSFGTNGIYTKSINLQDELSDLQIAQNGDLIITGTSSNGGGTASIALLRLNSGGEEKNNFGNQGVVLTNVANNSSGAGRVFLQNNKIVVSGSFFNEQTGNNDVTLLRYKSNGTLDNSFGLNGVVTNDLGGSESGLDIEMQCDNRFIVLALGDSAFSLIAYKK